MSVNVNYTWQLIALLWFDAMLLNFENNRIFLFIEFVNEIQRKTLSEYAN